MDKRVAMAVGFCAALLSAATARADENGDGTYFLDPNAVLQGEIHLETDNPSLTTGMVVNDYLGANRFYAAGITGQNTISAIVDPGYLWSGHDTLRHVSTFVKGSYALGETDRHATWVGMIIGGRQGGVTRRGEWQTGIAPATDLCNGAVAESWSGAAYTLNFNTSTGSILSAVSPFAGTADVINTSWGISYDSTGTNTWTLAIDGFARANPRTTFVASAGNYGPSVNTVTGPGSGYNLITVGALANDGANHYDTIASFSGRGPQNYSQPGQTVARVRGAVDLVAPGNSLVSAYYGGATGGNRNGTADGGPNYYSTGLNGTSFAAPIVAGGVALLDSASKAAGLGDDSRDSRVIRSVLMNSADKLPGWSNGQSTLAGIITTTQAIDWTFGAGRVNFDRAYDQYLSGTVDIPGLIGGTISSLGWDFGQISGVGSHNDYLFDTRLAGSTTLDVTLSWFRNRSVNVAGQTATDAGFANLDLEVWDSTFTTEIATSKSLYDSVEHLHFDLPQDGAYGLRVLYSGQRFGTPVPESYGLAWSGTSVQISPEPATIVSLAPLAAAVLLGCLYRRRQVGRLGRPA